MKTNFIINCATIIALGLVAAGCSHDEIEYKGTDEMQEQAKSTFPVSDIDPNQDWNTSTTRSATVSVGGEPYNSYDIYLFTEMPTSGVATPTVATQKGVRGGRTLQFSFDIAKGQKELYVGRNGVDGYFVTPVSLTTDSTYVVDMDAAAVATTRSFSDKKNEMEGNPFESVTTPYDNDFKTAIPSSALADIGSTYYTPSGSNQQQLLNKNDIVVLTKSCTGNYYNGAPNSIYINGDVTLSDFELNNSDYAVNVYVVSGTLTLSSNLAPNGAGGVNFYVSSGASFVSNVALSGNKINVYNRGTFGSKDAALTMGNGSMIYNEGTFNAYSILFNSGANTTYRGMLINKGKVFVEDNVKMTSNCSLLNDGYMKVGGSIYVTQSSEWLVNTGNLDIAKTLDVKAGNNTVYNACQIKIGETFDLTGGSGNAAINTLSDGAYYCTNLKMANNEVLMADRSAFIVTGTTTLAAQGGDDFQGFRKIGSSDAKALVDLGTILDAQGIAISHKNALQVAGNIVLTADNISTLVNATANNGVDKVVLLTDGATYTLENDITITPNNSETATCLSWSTDQDDGSGTQTEQTNYTYAFEDMKLGDSSDYDFNDVVLRVTTPDTEGKVTVTLEAAGATRQIAVKHRSTDGTETTLWEDVHTALGVDAGTMVNTGTGNVSAETPTYPNFYIGSITTNGDFYILVDGTTEVHIPQYTDGFQNGEVPYALQVTGTDWKWPKERVTITEAYGYFASWAENALENSSWYDTITISNVYTGE